MPKTRDAVLGLHLLEAEITTRCNLSCLHCYNRTYEKLDMPLTEVIELIGFAESNGVRRFVVSGGEAALHPDFRDLCRYLIATKKTRTIKTVVQSNGLIGKDGIEFIQAFDIVHLSFEPGNSEVRQCSVDEILSSARKFIDAGVYTYLFVTAHPGNLDKIDWIVETANQAKIDIGFNLCVAAHGQKLELSASQRLAMNQKLHQLYLEKKILRFTSPYSAIFKGQKEERYVGNRGGCTAGIAACVILPNGDVIPCPFFRIKAGNVHENDLQTIWLDSEIFCSLRDRSSYDDPCGSCQYLSYCGGCRACAYKSTGRIIGHDPNCIL